MLGRDDHGFVDMSAIALNAAIRGSIFADPDACFVMMMALAFGSTPCNGYRPRHDPLTAVRNDPSANLRSAVFVEIGR